MMGIDLVVASCGVFDREMGIAMREFVVEGGRATTAMV